ncbi:trehalose-6-phosphate synthase [Campylobacter ureolyticus]|uniref:trehalose-6-phosphate synthase n=1 Tax=Campylobacter ureolyticus TaxID=827 RepID=UPI002910D5D4|nr:trehalose-6-phosphate synthase [Campylobacter ureolyticus]MDU7071144.1 trehalose-6-phosphate synthase [Campylobacter ureolyticus]
MYFFALFMHLLCAIFFIGYVFFDVIIYPFSKKSIDEKTYKSVKKAYTKGSGVVFGVIFLLLLISGIWLGSHYVGISKGFFNSNLQIFLSLKILTIIFMCVITFISVYFVAILKKPDPFGKFSHLIALVLCIIIVFFAKAMWHL